MARTNPLFVLLYFFADLFAMAWLVHVVTGELPHQVLGLGSTAATVVYTVAFVVGLLSFGATIQHLSP